LLRVPPQRYFGVAMPNFELKRRIDLTPDDWLRHEIWSEWNNPEDMDGLVALGFDPDDVRSKLEAVKYSDEYAFPIPSDAAPGSLWFMDYSARVTTEAGSKLVGYYTGPALGVFAPGRKLPFIFNLNMFKECVAQGNELARMLSEPSIFPLSVEIVATGERMEFPIPTPDMRWRKL